MGAEAYTWVTKYKKNLADALRAARAYSFFVILGLCLTACTPSSSTGKKPEFFYKDAKAIELCNAISRNDEKAVDELLKQGVNINVIGKEGMTPRSAGYSNIWISCRKRNSSDCAWAQKLVVRRE